MSKTSVSILLSGPPRVVADLSMLIKRKRNNNAQVAALLPLRETVRLEEEVSRAEVGHQFLGNQHADGGCAAPPEQVAKFSYLEHEDDCPHCSGPTSLIKAAGKKTSTTKKWVLANEVKAAKLIRAQLVVLAELMSSQIMESLRKTRKVDLAVLLKASPSVEQLAEQAINSMKLNGWAVTFMEQVKAILLNAFESGAVSGTASLGIEMTKEAITVINEGGVRYASRRAAELVGMKWVEGVLIDNPNPLYAITETTRRGIRKQVIKSIKEGDGAEQLKERLMNDYLFSKQRSRVIARTELAFSHINGNLLAWQESGVVKGKRWLLADTHPEVDVCDFNDGEEVLLMDLFSSGHLSPPAHPNCLCGLVPIIDEEWNKKVSAK